MSINLENSLETTSTARAQKESILKGFIDYLSFGKEHGFLYSWKAVSRGKEIRLHKFQTLHPNYAKTPTDGSLMPNGKVEGQKAYNSFAEFMRKTHLDELPQLLNLFRGEIGIIGPRPNPDNVLEELFTGEDLELRQRYQSNAVNMDLAFEGNTWDKTVRNGTRWLKWYDRSKAKYGTAIIPTLCAISKFIYNTLIGKTKSE